MSYVYLLLSEITLQAFCVCAWPFWVVLSVSSHNAQSIFHLPYILRLLAAQCKFLQPYLIEKSVPQHSFQSFRTLANIFTWFCAARLYKYERKMAIKIDDLPNWEMVPPMWYPIYSVDSFWCLFNRYTIQMKASDGVCRAGIAVTL